MYSFYFFSAHRVYEHLLFIYQITYYIILGQLSILQPGDGLTSSISSLSPDLSEMAGPILALNPGI